MVQFCPFERSEKRTARRSYAFEMFRLLSRLATISLSAGGKDRRLTAEEIMRIADDFGKTKGITFKAVRRTLDLDNRTRFVGISDNDEKNDIVARHGNAAEGTHTLRETVGSAGWRLLMHSPVLRDRIAEVLTFREDPASSEQGWSRPGWMLCCWRPLCMAWRMAASASSLAPGTSRPRRHAPCCRPYSRGRSIRRPAKTSDTTTPPESKRTWMTFATRWPARPSLKC